MSDSAMSHSAPSAGAAAVAREFPISVNGRTVDAQDGEMLLATLRRAGVHVPTLCHIEGLLPTGACRLCVVEVDGQRGLVPSCAFPVRPGIVVQTHSPRALRARRTIVELLLSNHPDDCLYCGRNNDCSLQSLSAELGVRERAFTGGRRDEHPLDLSSPAIVRDPEKCILCGRCVRVCEEVQGVAAIDFIGRGSRTRVATAFDQGLNVSSCVSCGQCVTACPTGALVARRHIDEVRAALEDPARHCVVQVAPAVSVAIGELFGLKPGHDTADAVTTALRRLGFARVFETAFAADLTVMEEAAELIGRLQGAGEAGPLPLFTSCSPGWVKYVEQTYPDLLPHLSTCKSPQQMMGALVKRWYAQTDARDPATVFSVAVMPCTAKKFEAARPELGLDGIPDVDAVLTTRELAEMIRTRGLDLKRLAPSAADLPFGLRSSAGKLFGASGGVMEAALRTAHFQLTGHELPVSELRAVRGPDGVKRASLTIGGRAVEVAVVNGLGQAKAVLEAVRAGRETAHFIEVMTCPGGCAGGGGQPPELDRERLRRRIQALHEIDRAAGLRTAHGNPAVRQLYAEVLGAPRSERAHEWLHTHYSPREVLR